MENLTKKKEFLDVKCKVADILKVDANDYDLKLTKKNDKTAIPNFVMVMQNFAKYSIDNALSKATYQVIMYFISVLEYQNYINVNVKTISERLHLSERTILSSLKELKEAGIVYDIKSENDKRRNDYFINPYAMWRGRSIERKKCIKTLKDNKKQTKLFEEYQSEV